MKLKHIITGIIAAIISFLVWMVLSMQATSWLLFDLDFHPRTRAGVLFSVYLNTPLLAVASFVGILIYRRRPVVFGCACAILSIVSILLFAPSLIMQPLFLIQGLLLFTFGVLGSLGGWLLLKKLEVAGEPIKLWKAFAALGISVLLLLAWQYWYMNHLDRTIQPLLEAIGGEK